MSAGSEPGGSAFATPSGVSGDFSHGSAASSSASASASASGSVAGRDRSPAEAAEGKKKRKPPFRPAPDDTKPVLRDPISRSDPVETEQAVLRLPPFP